MNDWKVLEQERLADLTNRVNALYEGLSPMEIRKCVIAMCESQFLDLTMREVMDRYSSQEIVRVWSTEREAMDVSDIRWDHEHPGVKENAPSVDSYRVVSDTGKEGV